MWREDLRMLYTQLRACYKREFAESLTKEDTYVPYSTQCQAEKEEITNYYMQRHYLRNSEVLHQYQTDLLDRVDDAAHRFNYFGFNSKQIKNIALNYNWDDLRYNVWTNQVIGNKSLESMNVVVPFGKNRGAWEQTMFGQIEKWDSAREKHLTSQKPEAYWLSQTDKYWDPADLPMVTE